MRVQNITALFNKQTKDVLKNLQVLILFFVYPVVAVVMTQAMKDQVGMGSFFISIFATMHCVFTPIVATTNIIAEEKEKNTLRVLIMSNVTLREYLVSIGGFVLIATLLTSSIFVLVSDNPAKNALPYLGIMGIGSLISIVVGTCIGLYSKNMAAASGLSVPFSMVFAFLPMLAYFNKGIEAVSQFTYGQQLAYLLQGKALTVFSIIIFVVNFAALFVISAVLFKKSISEE